MVCAVRLTQPCKDVSSSFFETGATVRIAADPPAQIRRLIGVDSDLKWSISAPGVLLLLRGRSCRHNPLS
jgi:hypothetical protein